MSKWELKSLDQIANIIMGQSPPSNSYNEVEQGLPFLQGCAEFGKKFPVQKFYCTEPKKIAPANSILISVRAPVGLTNLADKDYVIGRGLSAIVPKESNLFFLLYSINHNLHNLEIVSQGSTFFAINSSELNNLKINCPEFKVQSKIANIIRNVDLIIEKTEQTIEKLKAIKQGMLKDLFTRGLDVKGLLRPIYDEVPELYRESELGWIPKEWEVGKLVDFASDKSYSLTGGPFGSDLQTKHYTNTGVRIIQLQNIGDGIFYDNYKIFTSKEKADKLFTCNIFPGEIIIAKMADPVARACIVPNKDERYLMASDGIRLSIDNKNFNTRFVLETINSIEFRKIAKSKSTGSTRERIGLTELREIPVIYPNIEEQNMISNKLDSIDNKIYSEKKYYFKSILLKKGLMQVLLSGKKL